MADERRAGRLGTVLLPMLPVGIAVGWLLLVFGGAISDGTITARDSAGWAHGAIALDEALAPRTGLRAGDQVVAVDGVPVDRLVTDHSAVRAISGRTLTYTVERPGPAGTTRIDVAVRLGRFPLARGLLEHAPVVLLTVTMYLVATFVIVRRPREPAARALYGLCLALPVAVTAYPFSAQVIDIVTGRLWPFLVGDLSNCLLWGTLLHFALVFPEPTPLILRRPRLLAAVYLSPFCYDAVRLAASLPWTADPLARLQLLVVVSQPAAHVQPVLVAAAMVVGYRSATDQMTQRRMRWAFVAVTVAATGYLTLGQLPSRFIGHALLPWDWLVLLFVPFPVALGLAVLRYRLFDIEIMVRRSLVLSTLTATLGGVYLLVVAGASGVAGLPPPIAPFVASLLVAVLFGPLRTQIRRAVSRSLFGDRDDPYEVMDTLGQRLAATGSADSVLLTLVETLADTLRLSYAAIELRGAAERAVAYGVLAGSSIRIPIMHAGEQVGELEIDPGPRREPFGIADRKLLDGLARQVGVISQNLLLEMRLRQSLERLVTAREEERRRLRRDLHDGLGPSLATTAMQVELAAGLIDRDPVRAKEILTGLGAAQREAVAGLRRLVDGLRPPVLDRLGLVGALREQAAASDGAFPAVAVHATDDVEPLPAAVEVAAYRLTQESLTNVLRHARASRCDVRLWREGGALLVRVADDGCGLPNGYRAGVGIDAIRERAIELGGSASVTAGSEGGTVVFARLPVRANT